MYGKFGDITRYLRTPHSLPNLVTSGQKNKIKKRPKYLESGSQNAKSIQWIPFLLLSRILKILCISSSNISVSVFVATYVIFFYQISFQISLFFEKNYVSPSSKVMWCIEAELVNSNGHSWILGSLSPPFPVSSTLPWGSQPS